MAKIDLGTTSSTQEVRGKRWVEVPQKDIFDFTHEGVRINHQLYGPGKHFVEADVADWIELRLAKKAEADLHIMRPTQDITSQNAMNRFGAGAGRGSFVQNPDEVMPG